MIGQTVSHYEILQQLGKELPGSLYKARELESSSLVALRILPASFGREQGKRLILAASAASRLAHPCLESILEFGETDDGSIFYSSELEEGETLDDRIARGPLAPAESLEIACQAAEGLERAHAAGIVHGALRPEHLRLTDERRVKILGFGLSAVTGSGLSVRAGDPLAVLAYRSPEQIRGGAADPRADLWALVVILYEMITGGRPFDATTAGALAEAILGDRPTPVAHVWGAAPVELDRLMARALAKESELRHARASELRRDLDAVAALVDASAPPVRASLSPAAAEAAGNGGEANGGSAAIESSPRGPDAADDADPAPVDEPPTHDPQTPRETSAEPRSTLLIAAAGLTALLLALLLWLVP